MEGSSSVTLIVQHPRPFVLQKTGKSKVETEAEGKKGKIDIVALAGDLIKQAKEKGSLPPKT